MTATASNVAITVRDERVVCAECGYKSHSLVSHLQMAHDMSVGEYLIAHPGAATLSQKALDALNSRVSRSPASPANDLSVKFLGVTLEVDAGVAAEDCKPLPWGYMEPSKGKAKASCQRVVMAVMRRDANDTPKNHVVFFHGMPGTGKDALIHALSYYSRRPVFEVTFRPGTDLAPMFYTRSIDQSGTGWEYGDLWRVLIEGVKGRDGVARPAIVLLSDVDRADSAQAEWFRILTDSMGGRIMSPHGKMVPLFAGTQFVCTANSVGSGDERGRMVSANPMDASLLDRLGRKVQAHYLHWDDEARILRGKFPTLAQKCPEMFEGVGVDGTANGGQLGEATDALRAAIENEELYAEFTHRGLCEVLSECDDIVHFRGGSVPSSLLKKGFRAWLDGLGVDDRLTAKRLIDPFIKGGSGAADDDDDE